VKHHHKWLKTLMESLDVNIDEETRAAVLENCGRACIPRSFVERATACKKDAEDLDQFLDELAKKWSHLRKDGDEVYVVYEKCYCPLLKDYRGTISPTFCNCSRGWIKELFESALERPVEVELMQAIRQGDDVCRFRVIL